MQEMVQRLPRRTWLRLGGISLVMLLACGLYGLHSARQSFASQADVVVTLLPEPNVTVEAGSIVSYYVQVKNIGDGNAERVLLEMPYDPAKLTVLDATFERSSDWVTAVRGDYLTMSFGHLPSNSSRTAVIRMQVLPGLPQGTVIDMWAGYGWDGSEGGGTGRSANAAPLVVQNQAVSSAAVWMEVYPQVGQAGTLYGFFSDRFAPGERLLVSLTTPYGTQRLEALDTRADEIGRAWIEFASTGYPPGVYELVARGERTNLVAATHFTIE
jgi:hypothetical protein